MTRKVYSRLGFLLALAVSAGGCAGSDGSAGAPGTPGSNGTNGTNGVDAPIPPLAYGVFTGAEVSTRGGVAQFHGQAVVTAEDEAQGAPANPKFLAKIEIVGATADPSGLVTVAFTVKKKDGVTPVTNLTSAGAGIFKLVPAGGGRSFNRWVPYLYRQDKTVNGGYKESTSASAAMPTNGSLANLGGGLYVYTFGNNLATATFRVPIGGSSQVGYDRSLTHRVSVYLGGHSGPTGEADFDFVPDGSPVTQKRNIVQTAACQKCHAANEFHGHGGDRVTVEGCNTCHSPDSEMVNGAVGTLTTTTESIAMQVMIHRIHAGRELQSAPGADGAWFDDPLTLTSDESADNGSYRLGSPDATWRSAAFPAGLANCVVCHTGTGEQVNNWRAVPSRETCGSCHDLVKFETGTNHDAYTDDAACASCHPATAAPTAANYRRSVTGAHDFSTKDPRTMPEFVVSVSVSGAANGQYFVAGEAPLVTIQLYGVGTGALLDHTTVTEDDAAEGCLATGCPAADGKFRNANMYVTGPRAKRIPVLTTAARAKVTSVAFTTANLGAPGTSLRLIVDGGNFIVYPDHDGEDVLVPGDFTVTVPARLADLDAVFAVSTAVTPAEVVAWLNGPKATFDYNERTFTFADRAIAYLEGGKVSIRTRAKGTFNPTVQVPELSKALNGMFTDTAVKVAGSAAQVRKRTTASATDPKATFLADRITYALDPVDDLAPGTYSINLEFADLGRKTMTDFKTPSIAVKTFQVKQAGEEKPIAGACTSCHWSTDAVGQGVGYTLDFPRHNKPFNAQAVDQCGGCHMYKSGETVASRTWTTGGGTKPISKRVHAVHNGAKLHYPVLTVDHEESVVGRSWRIVYPQEVRNCESCHPTTTTSGTWATIPNRLACMGCHDADAALAHMRSQVYDPTPTAPWSGDEWEACATCH